MRMEQLRCLADIAETHSLTTTAQRLFMTQPAVSQRIKQLEQDLGVSLLVRTNMGVQLTADGEMVLQYARQILQAEENMKRSCERSATQTEAAVEVRICSTSSVTNIVLPDVIARLDAQQKNVSLKITLTNDIHELFQQVQEGICDLGILTYNAEALERKFQSVQDDLRMEILALDELVMVTDRKSLKENLTVFPMQEYNRRVKTLYNILPTEETRESTAKITVAASNDADFHRRMIEKAGAVVAMSGLAYQYFFSTKKYIGLPLECNPVPLAHAAVYRHDANIQLQSLIAMIARELYIK